MKSVYDVQQLLKRYGIYIYIGDRLADLELMSSEIRELYLSQLIQKNELQQALLILSDEMMKEKLKKR